MLAPPRTVLLVFGLGDGGLEALDDLTSTRVLDVLLRLRKEHLLGRRLQVLLAAVFSQDACRSAWRQGGSARRELASEPWVHVAAAVSPTFAEVLLEVVALLLELLAEQFDLGRVGLHKSETRTCTVASP